MEVELLLVPYDSAQRGVGLGAGPERLVSGGLIPGLARAGHRVVGTTVLSPPPGRVAEIRTGFGLMAALAGAVRTARAAGFAPVAESVACLLGTRDLDPAEAEAIARSSVRVLPPPRLAAELPALVAGLVPQVQRAYLHLDLDVLDPSEGQANEFAAAGGLSLAELGQAVGTIGRSLPIEAATLSAYDPSYDPDGRIGAAAVALAQTVVTAAAAQGSGAPR
jgi:arginase